MKTPVIPILHIRPATHSPGPWAHKVIALYNPLESTDELPRFDCSSYGGSEWLPKAKANARLIAASPDLYEAASLALEKLDTTGEYPGIAASLRAAVDKAEGQP